MESRFRRERGFGIGRHAVRDRRRERVLGGVDADVHLGRVPAVRGVDVVGTGAGGAHEIGRGAEEHVVARAGPRLVEDEQVVRREHRVVEEVQRLPALARRDRVRLELAVEVVRAVRVPEVAEVLVVARGAREQERVVSPDRVPDHLDEDVHVEVEELRVEARLRERVAHQRPGDRRVEAALDAVLELPAMEREEVRALLALDVDDLDVLAGLDLVGQGRRAVHAEVEARLGERGRELELIVGPRARPSDLHVEVRRRDAALQHGRALGRRDDHHDRPLGGERLGGARRRPLPEQPNGHRIRRIQALPGERSDHVGGAVRLRRDQRPQDRRGGVGASAERRRVVGAVRRERRHLRDLTAVRIADGELVVALEHDHGRSAGSNPVPLEERVRGDHPRDGDAPASGRDRHRRQPLAAGSFDCCSSASLNSCSASSRLPAASSFLTSFSTARRLYDWFQ